MSFYVESCHLIYTNEDRCLYSSISSVFHVRFSCQYHENELFPMKQCTKRAGENGKQLSLTETCTRLFFLRPNHPCQIAGSICVQTSRQPASPAVLPARKIGETSYHVLTLSLIPRLSTYEVGVD